MKTFVLVHGAWHGAWCWLKLAPLLEGRGHRVLGPSLAGLGDRAAELTADIGLSRHVADIADLIEREDLRDVILVGHSYGGMVTTGAADRVPDRVGHLVYLDTFVPRDGESMLSIFPLGIFFYALRRQARLHGDGWRVDPPNDAKELYGVTKEPDLSWVRRSQTPQSLKTFEEPLRLRNPTIVSTFPRTHIICTGRGVLGSLMQRVQIRRALPKEPGWRLRRLPTGHDCMITMPRELADLLLEIP